MTQFVYFPILLQDVQKDVALCIFCNG